MSFLDRFKPVFDDGEMLWSLCWKHNDLHRPNLSLTYTGRYRGRFRCWACSFAGKVTDSTLQEILKRCDTGKRKCITKSANYLQQYLVSRQGLICGAPKESLAILGLPKGIDLDVIGRLKPGWTGKSLLFPLYNEEMSLVGVHQRPEKRNLKGSTIGIFAPKDMLLNFEEPLLICEGVTDLICLLLMGFNALGRFSANTCNNIIKEIITDTDITRVIIIPDNDEIGKIGAKKLKQDLQSIVSCDILYVDERFKDVKDWYNNEPIEIAETITKKVLSFEGYINDTIIRASV